MRKLFWLVYFLVLGAAISLCFLTEQEGTTVSLCLFSGFALALLWERGICSFWLWWAAGVVFYGLGTYWLPQAISSFFSVSTNLSFFFALIFWLSHGLQFAVVPLLGRFLRLRFLKKNFLVLPLAWMTAEVWFPGALPWTLAHGLISLTWFSQAAGVFGGAFLSFLLLWWAGGIVSLFVERQRAWGLLLVQSLTIVLVFLYGQYRVRSLEDEISNARAFSVAMVQANLDSRTDFVLENWAANIEAHRRLSREVLGQRRVQLLIWPESAVGTDFSIKETKVSAASGRHPFPGLDTALLFGGQVRLGAGPLYHLSAFLLQEGGGSLTRYDKRRLIAFAEGFPFAGNIPVLRSFRAHRDYQLLPGRSSDFLPFRPQGSQASPEVKLGLAICYEELWPTAFLGEHLGDVPDVLISLSNDGWFLESRAPEQHNSLARWRAIELGRFLLRATNNGVTSVIDPFGRVMAKLPRGRSGVLVTDDIRALKSKTPFSGVGAFVPKFITLVVLLLLSAHICREVLLAYRKVGRI